MLTSLRRIARRAGLVTSGPLLFCHIPKCGGTSFRAAIESEYRPAQRLFLYQGELDLTEPKRQFLGNFPAIRKTVQIIYGHFSFGVHRFLGVQPFYATIVREPVDRVISLYHHLARDTSSPFFPLINGGLSVEQFVAGHFTEMTNNHMTRIIAGIPVRPKVIVSDVEALEQAKENIQKHFCIVGTTEAMSDTVAVLGRRFAWREHVIPMLNVLSGPRVELRTETRDVIVEHNQLDVDLYQWIRGRNTGSPTREGQAD